MITIVDYSVFKEVVDSCGGSRPFDSRSGMDNFFVYFDHRVELYNVATVNDRCQAPERLYMNHDVAYKVRNTLNNQLLSDSIN